MTYRTKNRIGEIPEDTEIRVAKYTGVFSATRDSLGLPGDDIDHIYTDEASLFRKYPDKTWTIVYLGDYVITDGEHIEVTNTDSGWDLLPAKPPEPEGVSFTAGGDNLYILRGDGGPEITVTGAQLRNLAEVIEKNVSPIEGARRVPNPCQGR